MYSLIKQLFTLLTSKQRKRFYRLQVLVIAMAVMELFSIASIGPFMALVADPTLIQSNTILAELYQLSGLNNSNDFLFLAGLTVLIMLGLSSLISVFTTWRLSLFAYSVGTEIANRLYTYYLQKNWLFHSNTSSSQLTKKITTETNRITQQIIKPLTQLNAKAFLAVLISIAILIYNPLVAFAGLTMFLVGYLIIYKLVRKQIVNNGKAISSTNAQRFHLMHDGFGGIKDILLLHRSTDFINQFNQTGKTLAKAQGINVALSETPRYFMEFIAFGAMIGLVLIQLKLHDGTLSQVLPILAVYALAGFKLLPALQQIYSNTTQIKGNLAAFETIKSDLNASQEQISKDKTTAEIHQGLNLDQFKNIVLENITFFYPNKETPALKDLSLHIPINTTVGFVGESGSGKSTTIDLILGLIQPDQGQLCLDHTPITAQNLAAYQANIGFVPQSIFLSEGSIAENIAFGIKRADIDLKQVQQAIQLAHLEELVISLPEGLDTKVGERGVKLSGGQRQRIGIARALYHNSHLLVFDEATSALDGITEKIIMDAIHELSGQRTIILIAHRLKTVQKCDTIFLMEKGKLIGQGSYIDLVERNIKFKEMDRFS